jgi:hypothetical protein
MCPNASTLRQLSGADGYCTIPTLHLTSCAAASEDAAAAAKSTAAAAAAAAAPPPPAICALQVDIPVWAELV